MFDERDEQDFLDFDDDGGSDRGERWSALQIVQEREEENAGRENCEDGSEYGLDSEDHETEEEYEEALEEEKHGWRLTCEDGSEYGLDPEDYETEDEYNDALYEEKCTWREDRTDGTKYGLTPDDYESDDEFEEALDKARKREKAEAQIANPASGAAEAAGGAPDLYGRLRQEAVERLEAIRAGFYIFEERKKKQEEIDKCGFILHSDAPAARYLSVDDGLLYWQAIRAHFTLPIDLPDPEAEPDSDISDIFLEPAAEDPALEVQVGTWCVPVFVPYRVYDT